MVGTSEKQRRHLQKLNRNQKGNKNRNWKGGVNQIYYQRLAKENLLPNCYFCNSKKDLGIHHLDENRKNNNLKNLVVVCKSCHKKVHYILKKRLGEN
jgi:hypothetical protein